MVWAVVLRKFQNKETGPGKGNKHIYSDFHHGSRKRQVFGAQDVSTRQWPVWVKQFPL